MDDSVIAQQTPTHYCEVVKGLLKVPWTARRSNQLILRAINREYSLEKTLMLGKIEGRGEEGIRGLHGCM